MLEQALILTPRGQSSALSPVAMVKVESVCHTMLSVSLFVDLVLTLLHSLTSPELGLLFYYSRAQHEMRGGCALRTLAAPTHHFHLHLQARASLPSQSTLLSSPFGPCPEQVGVSISIPYLVSLTPLLRPAVPTIILLQPQTLLCLVHGLSFPNTCGNMDFRETLPTDR